MNERDRWAEILEREVHHLRNKGEAKRREEIMLNKKEQVRRNTEELLRRELHHPIGTH
jgi:hypothetical protein